MTRYKNLKARLLPSAILGITGAIIGYHYIQLSHGSSNQKLIAYSGDFIFAVSAIVFLNVLANAFRDHVLSRHLGTGRGASIQFLIRIIGYLAILLMTLNLLHIPLGKLLLGGALLGIILGVAAQQSLGNFFASIILIAARPFTVGQHIILNSGALGGIYEGTIKDIGLVYTTLLEDSSGTTVRLPNATLLSGASIRVVKKERQPETTTNSTIETDADQDKQPKH